MNTFWYRWRLSLSDAADGLTLHSVEFVRLIRLISCEVICGFRRVIFFQLLASFNHAFSDTDFFVWYGLGRMTSTTFNDKSWMCHIIAVSSHTIASSSCPGGTLGHMVKKNTRAPVTNSSAYFILITWARDKENTSGSWYSSTCILV